MGLNYKQANEALYRKKFVSYSLLPRNLKKVGEILRKNGYRVKFIPKKGWAELDFVRDGSMLVLEDTLLVFKGRKFLGFVTPTKLIAYENLEELRKFYNSFLTLKELSYLAFLAFIALSYLALRGV